YSQLGDHLVVERIANVGTIQQEIFDGPFAFGGEVSVRHTHSTLDGGHGAHAITEVTVTTTGFLCGSRPFPCPPWHSHTKYPEFRLGKRRVIGSREAERERLSRLGRIQNAIVP